MTQKNRNAMYDNLKVLLMFLVVFGHFIEEVRFQDEAVESVYNFIYLFHMPLFAFCSGAFAKPGIKRALKKLLLPYVIFQILYGVFDIYIMQSGRPFTLTNCYYVLWYLPALAVWSVSIPLFQTENRKKRIGFLLFSVLTGLLAGYADWIGKELSLSRILVFFPFFILGCYFNHPMDRIAKWRESCPVKWKRTVEIFSAAVIAGALVSMFYLRSSINTWALFEYTSYRIQGYNLPYRLMHYMAALGIGAAFLCLVPGKKNYFPGTAKNMLQIYLLHVLIVKLFAKYGLDNLIPGTAGRLLTAGIMSAAVMYVLGRNVKT